MLLTTDVVKTATTPRLKRLLTSQPLDANAWSDIASDDLHVRIGNASPAIGKDAALAELELFFARINSMGTGFLEIWRRQETVYAELEVQFTEPMGCERRIPCAIVARITHGSLRDLRFHLDPSPISRSHSVN
jgi:hypothetical protein